MKRMIKRIIVGVSIALILGFIRSCEVKALTIDNQQMNRILYSSWANNVNNSSLSINSTDMFGTNWWRGNLPIANTGNTALNMYKINFAFPDIYQYNGLEKNFYDIGFYVWFDGTATDTQDIVVTANNQLCTTASASSLVNMNFYYNSTINWFEDGTIATMNLEDIELIEKKGAFKVIYCQNVNLFDTNALGINIFFNGPQNRSYSVLISKQFVWQINTQQSITQGVGELNDTTKEMVDEAKKTNDFLTDTSTLGNSDVENIIGATDTDNANVSDLVNLIPQTLQVIINGFERGCIGGYSLGSLFGTELVLPCINPVDYLGSFLWGMIDAILCLCYLIPFSKWLVNTYNDLTSLKNRRFQ